VVHRSVPAASETESGRSVPASSTTGAGRSVPASPATGSGRSVPAAPETDAREALAGLYLLPTPGGDGWAGTGAHPPVAERVARLRDLAG
jgi:hypothetical protein